MRRCGFRHQKATDFLKQCYAMSSIDAPLALPEESTDDARYTGGIMQGVVASRAYRVGDAGTADCGWLEVY
jgi:hypothetical protein